MALTSDDQAMTRMSAPFRYVGLNPPQILVRVGEGALYLRHPDELEPHDADLVAMLDRCCRLHGDRPFLAERVNGEWRRISFVEFHAAVERAANVAETFGVGAGTHVALLAPNSIEHAVATFAILAAGGVTVPLAPVYLTHPNGSQALASLVKSAQATLLLHADALQVNEVLPEGPCIPLRRLVTHDPPLPGPSLEHRSRFNRSKEPAKIFFTSGSTGTPKPVVNTHGALMAAAAMVRQIRAKLAPGEPSATVDWLPWSHTFGGNVNVHGALLRGSTLHIDTGAPVPGRFDITLANLRDVRPTEFSTVPAAYPLLLNALENDREFAQGFFSRMRTCSFGGAALSPTLADRFQSIAIQTCGERIPFGGGYGMTESSGMIALVYWQSERTDLLGLPPPGMELKLVRLEGNRWECRTRGPNLFSGYLGESLPEAFDDEGFFITGDTVELANPERPVEGLIFAGRRREDFKLANGTWVRAGRLREQLLDHLRPLVRELVIVGENRDELGLMVWPGGPADEQTLAAINQRIADFNASHAGASQRIGRMKLCDTPANYATGEVTAKGTINVRRFIDNRKDDIDALYRH